MVGLVANRPAAAAATTPWPSPAITRGSEGDSVRVMGRAPGTGNTATGGGTEAPLGMASWVSSVKGYSMVG